MRLRNVTAFAAGLLLAAGAVPAHADLIPVLVGVTPSADGGFLWHYEVTIAPDQKMSPLGSDPAPGVNPADDSLALKDFLTFYDFGGFNGVVIVPAGMDWVSFDVGATPTRANPDMDLESFANITVFKIGSVTIPGPFTFTVSIGSTFDTPVLGFFSSDGTKRTQPGNIANNTGVSNAGRVETPFRVVTAIPEPGTLLLMGAGLIGLGIFRRRK